MAEMFLKELQKNVYMLTKIISVTSEDQGLPEYVQ